MSLTKEAVSAAFIRGYEAALCNHGIPGRSLRQEDGLDPDPPT